MRAIFGRAINILRHHVQLKELTSHLARDIGSRHLKSVYRTEGRQAAATDVRQHIDRVRRHTHHIGRPRLQYSVERANPSAGVVQDQFTPGDQHLLQPNGSNVVAHRT